MLMTMHCKTPVNVTIYTETDQSEASNGSRDTVSANQKPGSVTHYTETDQTPTKTGSDHEESFKTPATDLDNTNSSFVSAMETSSSVVVVQPTPEHHDQ